MHHSLSPQTRFFSILVPALVAGGVSVAMMVNVVKGNADQFTWTILLFSIWVVVDHVVALAHPVCCVGILCVHFALLCVS